MICLKLATRTSSFQVEVDATPADRGAANINYERKPLAVPGTWNPGTNYADSRYQLPQIDNKAQATTDSERIRQLEKENAKLREERDILRKAAKYFAEETRW